MNAHESNRIMFRILTIILLMSQFILEGQVNLPYQEPHDDIKKLADVELAPLMTMNHQATTALLLYRSNFKSIEELSQEEYRLAGLRINPATNVSSRARYYTNIKILDVASKRESDIEGLPDRPRITNITWSHDQNHVAFANITASSLDLWVVDIQNKSARKLSDRKLNANLRSLITWLKDDQRLVVKTLPEERVALVDRSKSIPTGPTISVNEGQRAQNRTYQDLLKNPVDESNFESLALSELWEISLDGSEKLWAPSNMYLDINLSPDGRYVLVSTISRPFSYIVPYYRFPRSTDVYDQSGAHLTNIASIPLVEEVPKGFMATRMGPRNISWRLDRPATLYWVEALDKGDPEMDVEFRDEVFELNEPFEGKPGSIAKTQDRFRSIIWGQDDVAVINEIWWNTRKLRVSLFNPSNPESEPVLFSERNYQDRYSDPGTFVTDRNAFGKNTLVLDDGKVFLLGDGYSQKGKHPFVDQFDIHNRETKRLWQDSDDSMLEDISGAVDITNGKILVRRESKNEYPNFYIRNIHKDRLEQITFFKNPFEALNNVHKEVISYQREDGLDLTATLYLPVGYDKESRQKMPMLMWAYPREYKDKNSASQTTNNANEFTYPYYGSPLYWVNRGYVVLEDVAFPIIGEGDEEPNDNFVNQLVANGKAAIDAVDNMGYIDRSRVGVGGHSYGAFMTANLLSHSNLFAAGIARSGAYNRTLTPFGFQSEERSYWEAPEVYYSMSPFMHADKMKTPLLLIHGEADNNSGTYPMQSERYFNALKGLGANVRLVMLPKESHGYAARESIMHMLWEQDQWLEKYVKNRHEELKP